MFYSPPPMKSMVAGCGLMRPKDAEVAIEHDAKRGRIPAADPATDDFAYTTATRRGGHPSAGDGAVGSGATRRFAGSWRERSVAQAASAGRDGRAARADCVYRGRERSGQADPRPILVEPVTAGGVGFSTAGRAGVAAGGR